MNIYIYTYIYHIRYVYTHIYISKQTNTYMYHNIQRSGNKHMFTYIYVCNMIHIYIYKQIYIYIEHIYIYIHGIYVQCTCMPWVHRVHVCHEQKHQQEIRVRYSKAFIQKFRKELKTKAQQSEGEGGNRASNRAGPAEHLLHGQCPAPGGLPVCQ